MEETEEIISMDEPIYIDLVNLKYVDRLNKINKKFDSVDKLAEYVEERACRQYTTHTYPVFHSESVIIIGKNKIIELRGNFYSGIPLRSVFEVINKLK
ncbi:MAG: hypothetical protein ACP5G1_03420 [Nanopusillaceae archaeon]